MQLKYRDEVLDVLRYGTMKVIVPLAVKDVPITMRRLELIDDEGNVSLDFGNKDFELGKQLNNVKVLKGSVSKGDCLFNDYGLTLEVISTDFDLDTGNKYADLVCRGV